MNLLIYAMMQVYQVTPYKKGTPLIIAAATTYLDQVSGPDEW